MSLHHWHFASADVPQTLQHDNIRFLCLEGHSADIHSHFAFLNIVGIRSHFMNNPLKAAEKCDILNADQSLPKCIVRCFWTVSNQKRKKQGTVFNISVLHHQEQTTIKWKKGFLFNRLYVFRVVVFFCTVILLYISAVCLSAFWQIVIKPPLWKKDIFVLVYCCYVLVMLGITASKFCQLILLLLARLLQDVIFFSVVNLSTQYSSFLTAMKNLFMPSRVADILAPDTSCCVRGPEEISHRKWLKLLFLGVTVYCMHPVWGWNWRALKWYGLIKGWQGGIFGGEL